MRTLGKLDQFIAKMQEAVKTNPNNSEIHQVLGRALWEHGDHHEAVQTVEAALQQHPTNADLKLLLAGFLSHFDKLKSALSYALSASQDKEHFHQAEHTSGVILLRLGAIKEASNCFHAALASRLKHPDYPPEPPPAKKSFNLPENQALLWQALVHLSESGIHAFATAGTLLGLTREGALLPYDKDLDIGVPYGELDKACHCLTTLGWKEAKDSFGLINPRAFVHTKLKLSLDLCGYLVEKDTGITIGGLWRKDLSMEENRVTEFPTLTLKKAISPKGQIWHLENADAFLTALYGDWKTPDPDFYTVTGAPNLRGFSTLTHCYALYKIYQHWENNQLNKAQRITLDTLKHRPDDPLILELLTRLKQQSSTNEST